MSINPKRLIGLLKKFKNIHGIEVFVNYNDKRELKYLEQLVYEIKTQD